jgi:hypothetical protein
MRFVRKTAVGWLIGATALLAGAAAASAATIGSLSMRLEDGSGNVLWSGEYTDPAPNPGNPNLYEFADGSNVDPIYNPDPDIVVEWSDVEVDIDPGIAGNFAVTNTLGVAQIFTLIIDAPVAPVAPSSLMFGSSTISVSDANFSGAATLSTVGLTAGYNGRIDLLPVTPATDLFTGAPYTLTAPAGGTIGDTESFGVFPGSVPGPAVAGFLGIQHVFSLSAGDRATFNSTFHVVVPEPGTVLLIGLGLAGLWVVRRTG